MVKWYYINYLGETVVSIYSFFFSVFHLILLFFFLEYNCFIKLLVSVVQ